MGDIFEKVNEQINPKAMEGNTVYIGLENIESNSGRLVGEINSEMGSIKSIKSVFKKGDILFGKLRPNLNKIWFADRDGICSTDILVLRSKNENIIPELYAYVLRDEKFTSEVMKGLRGAQLPRINFEYLSSLNIPIVSIEVQKRMVEEMEKEEEIIASNRKLIEVMEKKISGVLNQI